MLVTNDTFFFVTKVVGLKHRLNYRFLSAFVSQCLGNMDTLNLSTLDDYYQAILCQIFYMFESYLFHL